MSLPQPGNERLARDPGRAREVLLATGVTRYWEYGPAGTGADADVTIVMVHGFRGDHHGLEPIVAHLHGVRILSPDLPGFGASDPLSNGPHDIDGYASWLREFASVVVGRGRVVILGHSFGSIVVSAALAAGLPADEVVLVNPIAAPALSGPRGILTRLAVFYYWAGARLPERVGFGLLRNRVIVRVMSIAMAKTRDKVLRRFIHDQHDRYFSAFADRRVVLEAFRASVGNDVSEFAARIPQPTLLVASDRDDITPLPAQERLARLFPNATLRVIANVGHLIHYEAPAAAAAFVQDVLEAR